MLQQSVDEINDIWSSHWIRQDMTRRFVPQVKNWLVVSTPLKNISQWEGLSHILWKKCLKPPTRESHPSVPMTNDKMNQNDPVVSTLAISKRGLLDDTPEKCTSYGTTCSTWTRNMKKPHKDGLCSSYHLVMTNTSPWKDPPFLSSVNHLFRLGPSTDSTDHGELLVITRG